MKGLILIPKDVSLSYICSERYLILFEEIRKKFNFEIRICSNYNIDTITEDVVLVFRSPEKNNLKRFSNLYKLPKNKKLIGYWSDIHNNKKNKQYMRTLNRMMDRCDKILCPYDHVFRSNFKDSIYKYINFPQFAIHERYSNLRFNEAPIMKCLLSGHLSRRAYPIRDKILFLRHKYVDILRHPGFKYTGTSNEVYKLRDDYSNELNKYFCCITTPSRFNFSVAKYMEIPASGSLLLAKYTPDLDLFGFEDGINYIRIDENNFSDKLDHIISEPDKYENIRKNGREFILNNYTEKNNLNIFERMLGEL